MTEDARFEDGREAPLNLGAMDTDDLAVLSALCQDAVFPATEMRFLPAERRFALLLNRFRWEDEGALAGRHEPERVQSVLLAENVLNVASQGLDRRDAEMVLSLLSVEFRPGEEGAGEIHLILAGDGVIRLDVEALEMRLKDVTRPYRDPAGKTPSHPD